MRVPIGYRNLTLEFFKHYSQQGLLHVEVLLEDSAGLE
jgi:hypothetical protein